MSKDILFPSFLFRLTITRVYVKIYVTFLILTGLEKNKLSRLTCRDENFKRIKDELTGFLSFFFFTFGCKKNEGMSFSKE